MPPLPGRSCASPSFASAARRRRGWARRATPSRRLRRRRSRSQTAPSPSRGVVYKPPGPGPFPAVLYNHGSAPGMLNSQAFEAVIGPRFAARGWVFFGPYRRGQGLSVQAGPYIGDQLDSGDEERRHSGAGRRDRATARGRSPERPARGARLASQGKLHSPRRYRRGGQFLRRHRDRARRRAA